MSESEWRSPSHVLEVTIHRAYYPITEEVLHLVFDPFGEVEHVHVLGGSDHLLAQVVFKTKHAAAEAFGELHGRCVYTGCYQLDIKSGLSQDSRVSMEKGCPNTIASMTSESDVSGITSASSDTMANASPVRSASAATAMSTLNGDINSAMLPMEATATETQRITCAIAASYDSDDVAVQPVTVLDAMGHGIVEELQVPPASTQVQAPVASAITEEVIIDTAAAVVALPLDMAANRVFEEEMLSGSLFINGTGLEMLVKPLCKYLLISACSINTCELRRACVPLDVHLENTMILWPLLRKLVEQQPWPPPAELEAVCDDVELRPSPWPSFKLAEEVNIGWCFSLLGKTPWPPPTQNLVVQREFQWLLCWTYGAVRLFGVKHYAAALLCQKFMFLLQKLGDGFLVSKNEVQPFVSDDCLRCMELFQKGWQLSGVHSMKQKRCCYDIPCLLLQFWDLPMALQEVSGRQYGCEVTAIWPSQLLNRFSLAFGDIMGEHNTKFIYEAHAKVISSYQAWSSLLLLIDKNLQRPWDPGGCVTLMKVSLHRLEGKPNLKEGRMLGTTGPLYRATQVDKVQPKSLLLKEYITKGAAHLKERSSIN